MTSMWGNVSRWVPWPVNYYNTLINLKSMACAICYMASMTCSGLNPLIRPIYTADPSAHVFEGRIYGYPSHDRDSSVTFDMKYGPYRRSICVDRLYYNVYGSIRKVVPTKEGVVIE